MMHSSLVTWILVLSLLLRTIARGVAFTPTASPRFDVFSERILGSWSCSSSSSDDGSTDVAEVTEVMRSCGGAVQGVREVSWRYQGTEEEEGMYLNRANDGWAYWEDATYSLGPTTTTKRNDEEGFEAWTSLSLGKQKRLLLSTTWTTSTFPELSVLSLTRPSADDGSAVTTIMDTSSECPDGIEWMYQCQCRMSSPAQPWMMQRAKWESKGNVVEVPEDTASTQLQPWIQVEEDGSSSMSITVGASCLNSGYTTAVCRKYQLNGSLESILYLQGMVKRRGDDEL